MRGSNKYLFPLAVIKVVCCTIFLLNREHSRELRVHGLGSKLSAACCPSKGLVFHVDMEIWYDKLSRHMVAHWLHFVVTVLGQQANAGNGCATESIFPVLSNAATALLVEHPVVVFFAAERLQIAAAAVELQIDMDCCCHLEG